MRIEPDGSGLVVAGDLDLASAPLVRDAIATAGDHAVELLIHLGEVDLIDFSQG